MFTISGKICGKLKAEKSSEVAQNQKTSMFFSILCFGRYCQKIFSGGETRHFISLCSHQILRFSLYFSISYDTLVSRMERLLF